MPGEPTTYKDDSRGESTAHEKSLEDSQSFSAVMGISLTVTGRDVISQESAVATISVGYAADLEALRRWDATVDGMARTGGLVAVSRVDDRSVEGHTHEYLAQYFGGIPVHGGGVSRQLGQR